jgi:signal transduction histidine kinase
MIVDAAGVVHEGSSPLTRLHAVANAPIFSYDESFFGRDIVGGPLLLVADSSREAANVAMRILGGEKAGDIKTPVVQFAKPMFDWRQLQRWGISESRLPPGSEIHFRELTVWDRYRLHILAVLAAVLLQGALICWLVYEHWRRQIAEADALNRMTELARLNRVATAGQLAAAIAHEIRQPLSAIASSGNAGLNWLKHKVPNLEEARSALRAVVEQSHRADDVIKSVRSMFNNERSVRTQVNLNEIVEQVLTLTRRMINSSNIVLDTKLASDPQPLVMGDPVQLQQVILNLTMNAIEALTASDHWPRLLRIETGSDAGGVWLAVTDSGPGFDAKLAQDLFAPFVTTKSKGMGMGLSICKSIVEQHQGSLTASPVTPRGAMLKIELPHLAR